MSVKKTILTNLLEKNNYFMFITYNDNNVWNYLFYFFLFILIFFIYNVIINNLLKINIFNKKHLLFLNKNRNLTEILLKFNVKKNAPKLFKRFIFLKLV